MSSIRRFAAVAPLLGASALVVAGCGSYDQESLGTSEAEVVKCADGDIVKGIDISEWQGNVDFVKVKGSGITFVLTRISDGANYMDWTFDQNWAGIKAAGILRGAYQYFEPAQDPVAQANIVINKVGMLGAGDLPVMADVEATGGQSAATIVSRLQTWIDRITTGTGKAPIIYTGKYFWNDNVQSTAFGHLPLSIASYGVSCPDLPNGWSNWTIFQTSDSGRVNGIGGNVDTDDFNGSLADLQAFANSEAWGAKYVSQSFPLASEALVMKAGSSLPAYIELKNVGTKPWDSNTRLATSNPRDRSSDFAASDWIDPTRPSAVVNTTVPPGETYKFEFTLHAPQTLGTYHEFFGVVQEGTAWFSDPGQLGPPDNQLEVQIQVVEGDPPDPDAGAAGAGGSAGSDGTGGAGGDDGAAGDPGSAGSAGAPLPPDPSAGGGGDQGTPSTDDGAAGDGTSPGAPLAATPANDDSGCGCSVPGASSSRDGAGLALLIAGLAMSHRRRTGRGRRAV